MTNIGRISEYKKRDNRLKEVAIDSFKNHVIFSRTENSVVIKSRDIDRFTNVFGTEIMCGHYHYLTVIGDCDTVVFGHHGGSLLERITWIGAGQDVSYYVSQKARIGMTLPLIDFVPEFVSELKNDLIEETTECGRDPQHIIDAFDEAELHIPESVIDALINAGYTDAWEYFESMHGPCTRIYYAWAACRRAYELLTAGDP